MPKGPAAWPAYRVRGCRVWHHRMVLAMVALIFLAKDRIVHRATADQDFRPLLDPP